MLQHEDLPAHEKISDQPLTTNETRNTNASTFTDNKYSEYVSEFTDLTESSNQVGFFPTVMNLLNSLVGSEIQ